MHHHTLSYKLDYTEGFLINILSRDERFLVRCSNVWREKGDKHGLFLSLKGPCSLGIKTNILGCPTVLFMIITFIAQGFLVRFSAIIDLDLHKTSCIWWHWTVLTRLITTFLLFNLMERALAVMGHLLLKQFLILPFSFLTRFLGPPSEVSFSVRSQNLGQWGILP